MRTFFRLRDFEFRNTGFLNEVDEFLVYADPWMTPFCLHRRAQEAGRPETDYSILSC